MAFRFDERPDDKRGGGSDWQRDEKGRKFRDKEGVRQYENQTDRDSALEERYRLWCNGPDGQCCQSLLQHVMTHQGELLKEYMQWVHDSRLQHAFDAEELARWEVERFGDRAYPAAHAALLYAVKVAVFGDPYKRARKPEPQPKLTPGLSDQQRKDAMLTALHKVAESKEMPELGLIR